MQIYIPYENLTKSAMYLDDKRLNKQIIKFCQILSTALWKNNCDVAESLYAEGKIYLPTHENHPVVKWASKSRENYRWSLIYLQNCLDEYTDRFNKIHKCDRIEYYLSVNTKHIIKGDFKGFKNFTTNHQHIPDVHEAYKKGLQFKWKNDTIPPKWTNRKNMKEVV